MDKPDEGRLEIAPPKLSKGLMMPQVAPTRHSANIRRSRPRQEHPNEPVSKFVIWVDGSFQVLLNGSTVTETNNGWPLNWGIHERSNWTLLPRPWSSPALR